MLSYSWILRPPLNAEGCEENHVLGLDDGEISIPPAGCRRLALLVHGVATTWKFMGRLGKGLARLESEDGQGRRYYDWVGYVAFDWRKPMEENALALRALLEKLAEGRESVDLFGYSQGGLLGRAALDLPGAADIGVRHLVTFNTPHQGSPLGKIVRWMQPATRLTGASLGYWSSPGIEDLTPGSDFLARLEAQPASEGTRRLHIAGHSGRWLILGVTQVFFMGKSNDGVVTVHSQHDPTREGPIERVSAAWNHFTLGSGLIEAPAWFETGSGPRAVGSVAGALREFLGVGGAARPA